MWAMIRGCRAAFTFLTIIPVGGFPFSDATWRWSAAWFPTVGVFLGLSSAGLFLVLWPAGVGVAAIGAVTLTVVLTGAFHEDGLADSADALGGAYDREKLFAILKDSRLGTYGVLALILSVALRGTCLAALDERAPFALVVTHAAARTSPVWLMSAVPYVTSKENSKSRPVVRTGWSQAIVATASTVGLLILFVELGDLEWPTVGSLAACLLIIAFGCKQYFVRRAGGITGDFLGATEQLNEIAILLVLVLL